MSVTKEFWCPAHSDFDAKEPVCPHGCTVGIERHFRTAPGIGLGVAGRTDKLLEGIAKQHGLSDMNNRNGRPARVLSNNQQAQVALQEQMQRRFGRTSAGWGALPDAEQGGAPAAIQSMGASGSVDIHETLADVPKPAVHKIVDKRDPSGAAALAQVQRAAA
jgi:hypothetical protein